MPANHPFERSLAAKANAHVSWANTTDRISRTAPARAALRKKFLNEADGDPVRADHLWKAHFARLQQKSTQARRKAREQAELADAAEAALTALGDDGAPR